MLYSVHSYRMGFLSTNKRENQRYTFMADLEGEVSWEQPQGSVLSGRGNLRGWEEGESGNDQHPDGAVVVLAEMAHGLLAG